MRLKDGTLWPMPITLDVSKEQSEKWKIGDRVSLRDSEHNLIAVLTVESIYTPDKRLEAEKVFGTPDDTTHPSVAYLFENAGEVYVGGSVQGFQLPPHYDFSDIRCQLHQTICQSFAECLVFGYSQGLHSKYANGLSKKPTNALLVSKLAIQCIALIANSPSWLPKKPKSLFFFFFFFTSTLTTTNPACLFI